MELSEDPKYLDAHWTKDQNGKRQFFIINEAIISKLCILGEKYTPCFEGSNITAPKVEFSFDDGFKEQLLSMMTEIKNILNEGGAFMATNENTSVVETPVVEDPVVETPVVEEPAAPAEEPVVTEPVVNGDPVAEEPEAAPAEFVEDKCPECGKPKSECKCDKDEPAKYVLEEIPEYVELQSNHADLETKYSDLKTSYDSLKIENEELVRFKASVEKKEKEAMIKSFYMLSDEAKKEVIDNIDSYSLDDIEAKLAILCVRNKVSFDLDNDKQEPVSYGLEVEGPTAADTPEWVKAIQEVAKSL